MGIEYNRNTTGSNDVDNELRKLEFTLREAELGVSPTYGTGAPTTTPEYIGQMYLDTTAKREYRAYGTSSSTDWLKVPVFASGLVTITSGGGDKTVTLPWDWSGGFLKIYQSTDPTRFILRNTAGQTMFETSYDALTNTTTYTNGNEIPSFLFRGDGGAEELFSTSKGDNQRGIPKSATSTTFVLKDKADATMYVKWFVWA